MGSVKITALTVLMLITVLNSATDCDKLKSMYEEKLEKWNDIQTQMRSIEITKERYDELLPLYNELWQESEKLKADYMRCVDEAENRHRVYYNEGIQLKRENKFAEALEKFVEATKLDPDFEEAYEQAADVSVDLGNYAEMEKYLERVNSNERKGRIYNRVGNKYRNSNPDRAIEYYSKMARIHNPENAFYLIGVVYAQRKNEPAKAVEFFRRSLQHNPRDHKVFNALGASIVDLGNAAQDREERDRYFDEAISVFLKGIELGPRGYRNFHELCIRLSQIYNIQGRAISALEYADRAIQHSRDSKYSWGHLERAVALIKMERFDEAKRSLAIAQEDFSMRQAAEGWLQEIERLKSN